ncbi:hypothetical protein CAPTEDRAFT_148720 [Capitella teleta]|uniref:Cell division control protein n=1 Tax=Capitella teleta TaxID=283909 RepID=R7TAL5_CAPTE|nr:hypothetical protein CAPTEDRAFT_148720 [Capitella teleta]|eukprot:ELT90542.1 hypothetical protein CAPTEDRAFT_148720 [Capitella teleta]
MLLSPQRIPLSPRKDVLINSPPDCYQNVKKALHTALPDRLLCREAEMKTVNDFLDVHLGDEAPGSLYISGAPGTGKTAVVSLIRQRLQEERTCQSVYVNCMSVQNPQAIFNKIYSEFNHGKELSLSVKAAVQKLEKVLSSKGSMVVLILDEIDQLDCRNQEILYTMFEWPTLANSRLVLIGIANALDLTDRILPRLQARPKCRPQLLNFTPYTKDQLIKVLKDRLQSLELNGHSVIEPSAVQFCAMKVAAVAGDMRKALDVCRRAVEAVETEVRKQQVLSPGSPSKRPTVPKKIGVAHILRIVNTVYGSKVSSQPGQVETIPLQQKLAMCTLLMVVRQGKGKETTLGKFHEFYSSVCKGQKLQPVDQSEFFTVCSHMETRGIIRIKKSKDARNAKVNLGLDEKELEIALQDKTLLSAVLDKGLKGK